MIAAPLTVDDVKAIRQAKDFCVWIEGTPEQMIATLSVSKDSRVARGPFQQAEGSTRLNRKIVCRAGSTQNACFVALYRPGAFVALGQLVRPGDTLTFRAFQNNNQYMDHAVIPPRAMDDIYHKGGYDALHVDVLAVTITRPTKSGRDKCVVSEWTLEHSVCPDNSARALRPAHAIREVA